jgi:hypothetical protein
MNAPDWPPRIAPMLATARALPLPTSPDWAWEFKWDFCARLEAVGQPIRRRPLRGSG